MTAKILNLEKSLKLAKELKAKGKKIVLVGGCFDILHLGHVVFLQKAKQLGDCLIVLLEEDKNIRQKKGLGKPINSQKARAKVLESLQVVDLVVLLKDVKTEPDYDQLVLKINPDFIAISEGDTEYFYKERSAKLVNAKLKIVTKKLPKHSSRLILKALDN